jgi:hypothetical protein
MPDQPLNAEKLGEILPSAVSRQQRRRRLFLLLQRNSLRNRNNGEDGFLEAFED